MLIRWLFRTFKLRLGSHIGRYISALVPWLVGHTCLTLNGRSRESDGVIPWARARGRPFGQQVIGFGETVLYKLPVKGPRSQPDATWARRKRKVPL